LLFVTADWLLIGSGKMVFQSSFMLTMVQPFATVTFPLLSALDSFRAARGLDARKL
jgi:hypothetical protein